jgi:hypothetical protein
MEPKTNAKRGRPIKYVDAATKEQAIRDSKLHASEKYYTTKSAQYCEKQRQYYQQHREEILQKMKENCHWQNENLVARGKLLTYWQ